MRIVYLVEWDAYRPSGVLRKVAGQFGGWRQTGLDAKLFVLSPDAASGTEPSIQGPEVNIVSYPRGGSASTKFRKTLALKRIYSLIREFCPDLIYYRQSSWTPGIGRVLSQAPCVVTEINSDDLSEIHHHGWLRTRYHLATRQIVLKASSGFVCVGRELGDLFRKELKPVAIIANGFDTQTVSPRDVSHNTRPQLVFVGTEGQAWHGIDKICAVAPMLPEFDFHLVGDAVATPPANVRVYGFMDWGQLDRLYRGMDLGISTLALHRKGIQEASSLKTREYLAYGLPVIGAYEDTDLQDCPFYLRLPNTESGVMQSVERIRAFVQAWKDRPIDTDWVRAHIDSSVKEEQRLAFFKELVQASRKMSLH